MTLQTQNKIIKLATTKSNRYALTIEQGESTNEKQVNTTTN